MTKDTALKMAHKSFMQLNERHPRKDNGNGYFDEEIQACKEALEQPAMTYEDGFAHGYEAHRAEQALKEKNHGL